MARLIYGAGLRLGECVRLRVKDVDFGMGTITVRAGKGNKDRTTLLPQQVAAPLKAHLLRVAQQHKQDCLRGGGYAPCQTRYTESIRPPRSPWRGSSYFLRPHFDSGETQHIGFAGIAHPPLCSGPSEARYGLREFLNTPASIHFVTVLPVIFSLQEPISAPFRICWGTSTYKPR